MRTLSVVLLGVLMIAFAGSARAQDDNAKKILGVWEVTKSSGDMPVGSTIEFAKENKLIAVLKGEKGEPDVKVEATYKVTMNKLTVTVKQGDQTMEEEVIIKKLTDDTLETEDKDKKIDVLKKKK